MKMLKKFFVAFVVLVFFYPSAVTVAADNSNRSVVLRKEVKDNKHNPETDVEGNRKSCRPVMAIISENQGCIVSGVDNNDILSYGAYDENEECIGVFYDNMQFASFILSQNGPIEIQIELHDFNLVGFIDL